MWTALKEAIFAGLQFLYGIVGDYGVAIILLTVIVRIVLMPLTIKQTKSMYEMQRIQPKIKELQTKYKKQPEKLQAETMKFYQENKVNPFGGCLPLLLQMPIFFALFQVLGTFGKGRPGLLLQYLAALPADVAHQAQRFLFILPDITKTPSAIYSASGIVSAIPYVVLVILFGLSTWLPQKLTTTDPSQQKIGMYMAVMMLWFGWVAPAGVLLYWITSSGWQIAQQIIMMRIMKKEEGAAA